MAGEEASAGSDAIVVGEDWISEHYFTTDATKESFRARVLARRKEWDAQKGEAETPRSRLTAARVELLDRFSTLDLTAPDVKPTVSELNGSLTEILGFRRLGLDHKIDGPVTFIRSAGLRDTTPLALVDAVPGDGIEALLAKDADNLVVPFEVDDKTTVTSVARLLSTLFTGAEHKPAFVLVLAGPHVLVAERERWPEGRYLTIDLQLVCERNDTKQGGELDRALACLSVESLAPDDQGDIWWTETLAESVKHTVGVSKDLREGVRLSIEVIANEVVRRRKTQGLESLPKEEAQPLAKQSLRFLYRFLFLLYAEASPELGVLPIGATEYDRGYSLDRLRELTLVELTTQRSQAGTHLYDSLGVLFGLVDQGHTPRRTEQDPTGVVGGLTFRSLRADLFKPEATAHIDQVGLGNAALQEVLRHLLLSKESRGRDRGFISYAELGINQLGAVYEGLMSYTGFFATDDLYEVAKDGNAEKGSWVVPMTRADAIADKDFVMTTDAVTGETRPVTHLAGSFVFRLAGRERQQSASYYTPEVLTRFVVSQALEELLDQDGSTTTAAEILELTICEPALGSGAFAIEAVRQLAAEYLERRQRELGQTIDPDDYPRELQRVKAYLALHQVYGVDLNATAVELAEISLWLDTMVEGLEAPWFGLHLRRGNSLIGARKAVFTREQLADKSWLKAVPKPVVPGSNNPDEAPSFAGRIPHFLLPADGWGAAADVGKEIKELAPDAVARLKIWRRSMGAKPSKKQVDALAAMTQRVQTLWEFATRRLAIADSQIRRDIDVWGRDSPASTNDRLVTREEIEESLADRDGAYQRLRRIMDAWCALWFWPLTEDDVKPPTLEQWYDALSLILGGDTMKASVAKRGDDTLESAVTWDELGEAEFNDRVYAGASRVDDVVAAHSWLAVCNRIAAQQGFFHWELDFATILEFDGFDLQLGNPPWVRPDWDWKSTLAEFQVRFALEPDMAGEEEASLRVATLQLSSALRYFLDALVAQTAIHESVASDYLYPHLTGLRPDLYRCFMSNSWRTRSERGVIGFLHPETHLTDEKAGSFRAACYARLRRHWHFVNELKLFEIGNQRTFGVNVYSAYRSPRFKMACSLYHPDTVTRSLVHDGSGPEPGMKTESGSWDLTPHAGRVFDVDEMTLRSWRDLTDEGNPQWATTKTVFAQNQSAARVLSVMAACPVKIADLEMGYGLGWNETTESRGGALAVDWGPAPDWHSVILQGAQLSVANPFFQQPNRTMKNHRDWAPVDLEGVGSDYRPVTRYKPAIAMRAFESCFPSWETHEVGLSAIRSPRIAWRSMSAPKGERTLMPALIPPGVTFVSQSVYSLGHLRNDVRQLAVAGAVMSSLLSDYLVRAVPKSSVPRSAIWQIPATRDSTIMSALALRFGRLNCLTAAYADCWKDIIAAGVPEDGWTGGINYPGRTALVDVPMTWTSDVPLRRAADRRQALVELDALVALMIGASAEELCTIYRTQFAVLYGYDHNTYHYDANGRLVPNSVLTVWRKKGEDITEEERTAANPSGNSYIYVLPFVTLDREADMRQAYAHFEKMFAENTGSTSGEQS